MDSKARAHVVVKGGVQGVYFRYATRDEANMRGIKGWVRNMEDGRVEAVFEGEKQIIDQAIKECRMGPPGARVKDIEVHWETFVGDQKSFMIRY